MFANGTGNVFSGTTLVAVGAAGGLPIPAKTLS
jgi:hypothetical protein